MNPFAVDSDLASQMPMIDPDQEVTEVYVNFYQIPGRNKKTSSVHTTRALADGVWQPPKGGFKTGKQRVACIRVSAICINGQFDN